MNKQAQATLDRLHQEAAGQGFTLIRGLLKGIFRKLKPEDMKDAYIAITPMQGRFLYDLIIKKKAKHIVEFGTSFGISTIYLAAAAKLNRGQVITTELLPEKCKVAQQNFQEAGLSGVIDLREGDAMQTLQTVKSEIDFVLLDGWNDLYLPLIKLLEPKLKKGALIYTDNASMRSAKPYLDYIQNYPIKYKTQSISDNKGGSELTEFIG